MLVVYPLISPLYPRDGCVGPIEIKPAWLTNKTLGDNFLSLMYNIMYIDVVYSCIYIIILYLSSQPYVGMCPKLGTSTTVVPWARCCDEPVQDKARWLKWVSLEIGYTIIILYCIMVQ